MPSNANTDGVVDILHKMEWSVWSPSIRIAHVRSFRSCESSMVYVGLGEHPRSIQDVRASYCVHSMSPCAGMKCSKGHLGRVRTDIPSLRIAENVTRHARIRGTCAFHPRPAANVSNKMRLAAASFCRERLLAAYAKDLSTITTRSENKSIETCSSYCAKSDR